MRTKRFGHVAVAALAATSFMAACGDDEDDVDDPIEDPVDDTGVDETTVTGDSSADPTTGDTSMTDDTSMTSDPTATTAGG